MAELNAKQVLSDLYGLMMEINFHRTDEDILAEFKDNDDPQIEKHLVRIRQSNSKLRAQVNKARFNNAIEQFKLLKQKGIDEIQKLIRPQEQEKLVLLFRKFEELTKEDQDTIMEDQELLHLLEILKDKFDDNSE